MTLVLGLEQREFCVQIASILLARSIYSYTGGNATNQKIFLALGREIKRNSFLILKEKYLKLRKNYNQIAKVRLNTNKKNNNSNIHLKR